MKDVSQSFEDLEQFLKRFDPFDLLSQLSQTYLFSPEGEFASESDERQVWARHIEFATGYYATRPLRAGRGEAVHGQILEEFKELMDTYFNSVNTWLLRKSMDKQTDDPPHALTAAQIYSMHVRGDAYPHQFKEYALAVYSPHDEWFSDNLGFTIAEAFQIAEGITEALNSRYAQRREASRVEAETLVNERRAEWEALGVSEGEALQRARVAIFFGGAKNLYRFTTTEAAAVSRVPEPSCVAFLRRMSQKPPYTNPAYPNTFTDGEKALWDYNTALERPFLTDGDGYWLISPHGLIATLYSTFYFDLIRDATYKPTFDTRRGKALEAMTANYLRRVFPSSSVHLNPTYPDGREFADACVLFDGKLLIVQCKGKPLTRAAHTGLDVTALRKDLQAAIKDAIEQGAEGRRHIEKHACTHLLLSGKETAIERDSLNEIILIAVTFMPLQAMATRLMEIEDDLKLPHCEYSAWAMSLGDLDLVTQVCGSPARLIHYLRRRLSVETSEKRLRGDEMDLLGFYVNQGLWMKADDFKDADLVALSGFSDHIDEYVFRRYALGESVAIPRIARPEGFDDVVDVIESLGSPGRTDCAIVILDISGKQSSIFLDVLKKAELLTAQDGETHTCSLGGENTTPGISFMTAPRRMSLREFWDRTQGFGHLKKYAERNGRWVALGWHEGSSRPIDLAFWLEFPFSFDEAMDQVVSRVLRKDAKRRLV